MYLSSRSEFLWPEDHVLGRCGLNGYFTIDLE